VAIDTSNATIPSPGADADVTSPAGAGDGAAGDDEPAT